MSNFNPLYHAFEINSINTEIDQAVQNMKEEDKLKKFLRKNNITSVWHFTDRSNLPSIMEHGILSLRKIEQLEIDVEHAGASRLSHSLDHYKNLDQYVHLAFLNDHPLYHVALRDGRVIDPVWIEIDISVLFEEKTLFCNQVANKNGAQKFSIDKIQKRIDFDTMIHCKDFDKKKEARKAEILILNHISPDKILGVHNGK